MGSEKLKTYLDARYASPNDAFNSFIPERLEMHGIGNDGLSPDPALTGYFYGFMTKPDLNLNDSDNLAARVLGIGTSSAPTIIADQLTGGSGFIKLFTNRLRNIPIQDVVLDTFQIAEGWDGARLTVPKNTLNSRQNGTFQLEFEELQGLPMLKTISVWVNYIEAVTYGTLYPKSTPDYIGERRLDYASSFFGIVTEPDGETIQLFLKYTGVVPTSIPYGALQGSVGTVDAVKFSVPFAYSYMEVLDPAIIGDFNTVGYGSGVKIDGASSGGVKLTNSGRLAYKLNWLLAKERPW